MNPLFAADPWEVYVDGRLKNGKTDLCDARPI
jgi:hypothetical protein